MTPNVGYMSRVESGATIHAVHILIKAVLIKQCFTPDKNVLAHGRNTDFASRLELWLATEVLRLLFPSIPRDPMAAATAPL